MAYYLTPMPQNAFQVKCRLANLLRQSRSGLSLIIATDGSYAPKAKIVHTCGMAAVFHVYGQGFRETLALYWSSNLTGVNSNFVEAWAILTAVRLVEGLPFTMVTVRTDSQMTIDGVCRPHLARVRREREQFRVMCEQIRLKTKGVRFAKQKSVHKRSETRGDFYSLLHLVADKFASRARKRATGPNYLCVDFVAICPNLNTPSFSSETCF